MEGTGVMGGTGVISSIRRQYFEPFSVLSMIIAMKIYSVYDSLQT